MNETLAVPGEDFKQILDRIIGQFLVFMTQQVDRIKASFGNRNRVRNRARVVIQQDWYCNNCMQWYVKEAGDLLFGDATFSNDRIG